jgi:polysaccharide pyruvyl transferase WcaK-like protein
MNDHQHRLWESMIVLIDSYLNGDNQDLYRIVGKLEGALDASEIKDNNLINQWYDFWTPLETRRAVEGNQPNKEMAVKELNAMKQFILKHL